MADTKVTVKKLDKKADRKAAKAEKKALKAEKKAQRKAKRAGKKPFILFRPFVALGHYIAASWQEIRQVRWPNRKATWKMVLAVFVYAAIFVVFIMLLDTLFTYLFNLILG